MRGNYTGLNTEQVLRSRALHGDNSLRKEKKKSILRRFIDNLLDPIIRILIIAVVLEVVITLGHVNYAEIFGILIAILISATVSTVSEYGSEKAFEKFDLELKKSEVSVLREGKIVRLDPSNLVTGDIVYLFSGEKIHADGEIIEGRLTVDQSALNGEGCEAPKFPTSQRNRELSSPSSLFRGSLILEGNAVMRVERVGDSTFYGKVAKDVQTQTRESPLKLRLERLAKQVSKIGYVVAFLVGVAYLFNVIIIDNSFDKNHIIAALKDARWMASTLLHALTLMITVVVVAAPEGLPMMITVVLSANMKRMIRDNVRVKKLVGIDTAGSLNILFTDKTGTLTVGHPSVECIITSDETYKTLKSLEKNRALYKLLTLNALYNTDVVDDGDNAVGGNSTDRAIHSFFAECKREKHKVIKKHQFTSESKYSSAELESGLKLIKGAFEIILVGCDLMMDKEGNKVKINRSELVKQYREKAEGGARVIAVAASEGEENYVFLAFIVMRDKLRKSSSDAIKELQKAGIQVVMITGDSVETAVYIAKKCGILNSSNKRAVFTGNEIQKMSDEELKSVIPGIRVISRALPEDKTRLVKLSQELELVVGMTGDGINDSPSLKLADVGFSMGSGTDIAKSASDIVILDDSITAIDKTVLYGRTIFKSIRKFITFQLIMNLAACGVSLIGQFIGIDTPITIIQMLWINIIMDTLGALAFAGEAALSYYMKEKPKSRSEAILTKEMLYNVFLNGAYTLALCIYFLTSERIRMLYGYENSSGQFYTAFYLLFVLCGIINCFCARCERLWILSGIEKNKIFILIMLIISVIQLTMIYYGGELFRCVPLSIGAIMHVVSISFTIIPFDIIRRIICRLI